MDVDSASSMNRASDEHPSTSTGQWLNPHVRGLQAAPTTQKYEGTMEKGNLQDEVILRGEGDWHCSLIRCNDGDWYPDYPVYSHDPPFRTYWVADVMCQMCKALKQMEAFSQESKGRIQRRAIRALNNDGNYEASGKRICCKTCVSCDTGHSAKTRLYNMVAKKLVEARVTISVSAVSSQDGHDVHATQSFMIGTGAKERAAETAVYQEVVQKLIAEMHD